MKDDVYLLKSVTDCDPNAAESLNFKKVMNECLSASKLCRIAEKFRTVGVIVRLLKARLDKSDRSCLTESLSLEYESLSISQGRAEICSLPGEGPIVFALDEFNLGSSDSDIKLYMLLARNIISELGLIALLMGTDSAAANLVLKESLGGTSSRDSKTPWCYLISKLPAATPETLLMDGFTGLKDRFQKEDEFIKFFDWICGKNGEFYSICQNSGILKLFVEICLDSLSKSPEGSVTCASLLDTAFERIGDALYDIKVSIEYDINEIATGQYLLMSPQQREQEGITSPSYLIHRHFAYLDLNEAKYLCTKDRELDGVYVLYRTKPSKSEAPIEFLDPENPESGQDVAEPYGHTTDNNRTLEDPVFTAGYHGKLQFRPNSLFPEFPRNELLYMALLDPRCMRLFTEDLTFATIARYGHEQTGCKSTGDSNVAITPSRNGSYLENVVQGASVQATHRSIGGVEFGEFFRTFLGNLGQKFSPMTIALPIPGSPTALESMWTGLVVPYTVCVGSDAGCSENFQAMPGTFTGVFKQVKDKEKYDGCLVPWFVWKIMGHCKDCKVCQSYDFSGLQDYLTDSKDVEEHVCGDLANALRSWKDRGILGQVHLANMSAVLFEMKDHEADLDAIRFSAIIERFVERLDKDKPLGTLKHKICVLVTEKCKIAIGKKFKKACDLFKGSIYLLDGASPELRLRCLHSDNGAGRVCFIVPGEQVLGADFHPFRHRQSSTSFNGKRSAVTLKEGPSSSRKLTRKNKHFIVA